MTARQADVSDVFKMSSDNLLFNFENADIPEEVRLLLSNMCIVESRLKWTSDFNELKRFVREFISLVGQWSTPGGGSKQFRCPTADVSLTWYHKKQQTLVFQGKNGELLKSTLIRIIGEAPSPTTNESQPENIDQVPSTNRTDVSSNTEVADDLTGFVPDRANRNCSCSAVLSELEDMKLNFEVLQLRVDSLQSLANAQKVCFSMDGYTNMIDCLKQELWEEKQERLRMNLDFKNLKDKLFNSNRFIQSNSELENDLLDNENFTLGDSHAPKATCADGSSENLPPIVQPFNQMQIDNFDIHIQTNSKLENDCLVNENSILSEDLPVPETARVDVSLENNGAMVPNVNNHAISDLSHQCLARKVRSLVDESSKPTNANKIDVPLTRQTRVASKSPVSPLHVRKKITPNCQNQTQTSSEIPEWMGCLPLINLPRPIISDISGGAMVNRGGAKKHNNIVIR